MILNNIQRREYRLRVQTLRRLVQYHDQESRALRSELFNLVECLSDDMDRRLSLETEVFDKLDMRCRR